MVVKADSIGSSFPFSYHRGFFSSAQTTLDPTAHPGTLLEFANFVVFLKMRFNLPNGKKGRRRAIHLQLYTYPQGCISQIAIKINNCYSVLFHRQKQMPSTTITIKNPRKPASNSVPS